MNLQQANGKSKVEKKRPELISMAQVRSEMVTWLCPGYLPKGYFTSLEGDEGMGKTLIVCHIAAGITKGTTALMRPVACKPSGVLFLTNEDHYKHEIKPRLEAVGADYERVFSYSEKDEILLPDHLDYLKADIVEKEIAWVVIDPLSSFVGRGFNLNDEVEARRFLKHLTDVCKETNVTFTACRHLNKREDASPGKRAMGSTALGANARVRLMVGQNPQSPIGGEQEYLLGVEKLTMGCKPATMVYVIETTPVDVWDKETQALVKADMARVKFTGESSLRTEDFIVKLPPGHRRPAVNEASKEKRQEKANWAMKAILEEAGGELASNDLQKYMEEAGFGEAAYNRAKKQLGVKSQPKGKTWYSKLPETIPSILPFGSDAKAIKNGRGVRV
jgi:archaellum biogenesis ATPase FlaH